MAKYIIDYDLNKQGKNYDGLIDAIKSYSSWAKICRSSWAIYTTDTTAQIRDNLQQYIDNNDVLFVSKMEGEWAAWNLSQAVVDWFKSH